MGVEQSFGHIDLVERVLARLADSLWRLGHVEGAFRVVARPRRQASQVVRLLEAEVRGTHQRRRAILAQAIAGEPFRVFPGGHHQRHGCPMIGIAALARVPANQGIPEAAADGNPAGLAGGILGYEPHDRTC